MHTFRHYSVILSHTSCQNLQSSHVSFPLAVERRAPCIPSCHGDPDHKLMFCALERLKSSEAKKHKLFIKFCSRRLFPAPPCVLLSFLFLTFSPHLCLSIHQGGLRWSAAGLAIVLINCVRVRVRKRTKCVVNNKVLRRQRHILVNEITQRAPREERTYP